MLETSRTIEPRGSFDLLGQSRRTRSASAFDRELIRKAIHLLVALIPSLALLNFKFTMVLLAAGTLSYAVAEAFRLFGRQVVLISDLTVASARDSEHGFVLGPVTLGIGSMLALLLYPLPFSAIAIYALAFGDTAASVFGMACGGPKVPLNRTKTISGSLACFAAVLIVTVALTGNPLLSIAVSGIAMTIEALSPRDFDNLLLPVGIGMLMHAMPTVM